MNNTISITAGELKSILSGLAKIIDTRAPLEALRSIKVESSASNITFLGSDGESFARARLERQDAGIAKAVLVPFTTLKEFIRRLPAGALVQISESSVQADLGTGTIEKKFERIALSDFPEIAPIGTAPHKLTGSVVELFRGALKCCSKDTHRVILQGVFFDQVSAGSHQLVGTDGRHLYCSKPLPLGIDQSFVCPSLPILSWRGLDGDWSMAVEDISQRLHIRIVSGIWEISARAIEGNYPNWKAVVPTSSGTLITFPENHRYREILDQFPAETDSNNSVHLVCEHGEVSLISGDGSSMAELPDILATGPDMSIWLNRDYLAKALDYGFTTIGLNDPESAALFSNERAQMVVMPLKNVPHAVKQSPTERIHKTKNTMTATQPPAAIEPTNNGNNRNAGPVSNNSKPAIEVAIDNLDSFKSHLREALSGISEITALLRQAIRDQRANEREIQSVRQTLRSLQGVRI
jgi:DNA polymerase III sliding clamp (beta) subunit (PCNA family)